jgi:hypothetical protein
VLEAGVHDLDPVADPANRGVLDLVVPVLHQSPVDVCLAPAVLPSRKTRPSSEVSPSTSPISTKLRTRLTTGLAALPGTAVSPSHRPWSSVMATPSSRPR